MSVVQAIASCKFVSINTYALYFSSYGVPLGISEFNFLDVHLSAAPLSCTWHPMAILDLNESLYSDHGNNLNPYKPTLLHLTQPWLIFKTDVAVLLDLFDHPERDLRL
jgi:hypothetical protein